LEYRRDIDGLRALAIIPVVACHAGLPFARGGYVGVDVFFVISGYLITRLLREEIASGSFSLIGFYERRARRILPALFVVLAAVFAGAWAIQLPQDLAEHSIENAVVVVAERVARNVCRERLRALGPPF